MGSRQDLFLQVAPAAQPNVDPFQKSGLQSCLKVASTLLPTTLYPCSARHALTLAASEDQQLSLSLRSAQIDGAEARMHLGFRFRVVTR